MEGLEDVEPLYPPDAFIYYDRYRDGDPYADPGGGLHPEPPVPDADYLLIHERSFL